MIKYLTIQKLAELIGVDTSYIRKMIKNKDLTAYKKDGYKRIYINIEEFNDLSTLNRTYSKYLSYYFFL